MVPEGAKEALETQAGAGVAREEQARRSRSERPPEAWPCGTVLPTDRNAVSAGCPSRWLGDGLQGGRLDVGRPEAAWGLL